MAQRTTDELKVFLEGTLAQYNALTDTDKAGSVFFDKANHAVYAKGECIIQSNIKDVTYNSGTTELTITPFTGSQIKINLGIQDELDLLKDNLEDWVADNFASTTILSTELDKKVDKVSGKGLSTNDYTTAEKNKLDDIEPGAQVNKISSFKANNTEVGGTGNKVEVSLAGNLVDSTNAATGSVKFNLSHKYVAADKKIYFFNSATAPTVGTDGNIFFIDTTDFVKDGILSNAEYNEITHILTLTFNSDAGKEPIPIDLSDLVNVYNASNGIVLDGATFKLALGDGVKVEGGSLTLSLGNGLSFDTSGKLKVDFESNGVTSINGMGGGAYTINDERVSVGTAGNVLSPISVVNDSAAKKLKIKANPKHIFAQFFHENNADATSGIRAKGVKITEDANGNPYSMLMDFTPKVWKFED